MLDGHTPPRQQGDHGRQSLVRRLGALRLPADRGDRHDMALASALAAVMRKRPRRRSPQTRAQYNPDMLAADAAMTGLGRPDAVAAAGHGRSGAASPRDFRERDPLSSRDDWAGVQSAAAIASSEPDDIDFVVSESTLPPQAVAWVRKARSQRARQRLGHIASLSLSVLVSTLVIAAAAWVMAGYPVDIDTLRRLTLQALAVG